MIGLVLAALMGLVVGAAIGCVVAGLCASSRRGEER
jgi:hypothetical protein